MSRWLVRHAPPDTLHPANAGRVRDAHQVGGPPEEVFRLDEMVTLNAFHGLAGERITAAKVNQLAPVVNQTLPMIGCLSFGRSVTLCIVHR